MNKMLQVQNLNTGRWENVFVSGLPDPQPIPQPPVIHLPSRSQNGHPLLIAGMVLGAVFGLLACLPASVRGWVMLAIIASVVWFFWTANHDRAAAQAYAGTETPVPAQIHHYPDYAPRAELVRLPNK